MQVKPNLAPFFEHAVSIVFSASVISLLISLLRSSKLRIKGLTFSNTMPTWARLGALAIQRRLAVYTHKRAPQISMSDVERHEPCLSNHQDKLAHISAGRVKGFTLLQETNWTARSLPLPIHTLMLQSAMSRLAKLVAAACAPPLGWVQVEHTEVIPGFLQDALYEKHGAQQRVVNVYVHPARTKELARVLSLTSGHSLTRVLSLVETLTNYQPPLPGKKS